MINYVPTLQVHPCPPYTPENLYALQVLSALVCSTVFANFPYYCKFIIQLNFIKTDEDAIELNII